MTFAVKIRVPVPVEAYDATHAEVLEVTGDGAAGLILHVARALPEGFEVFEVWQSREDSERFNREVLLPAMERAGLANSGSEPQFEEFEPRVVLVPQPYNSESS